MKIDRLLSIVITLLNRDTVPARELAERFEVSVRTIYRDIETINSAGIPVISYPGSGGGFGLVDSFRLSSQVFGLDDMMSVLSALKGIRGALDNSGLDAAIDKIDSLVPPDKRGIQERYSEQFVVDIMPWGYREKQKKLIRMIHGAIADNKLLTFEYRSWKGETLFRTVEPMTLIFKGYAWYLFAYCRLRKDFRVFRLSRMDGITIAGKGFIRREADWRDYMEPKGPPPKEVKMQLRFSAESRYRVEDYFGQEQIKLRDDGSYDVERDFPGGRVDLLFSPQLRR